MRQDLGLVGVNRKHVKNDRNPRVSTKHGEKDSNIGVNTWGCLESASSTGRKLPTKIYHSIINRLQ